MRILFGQRCWCCGSDRLEIEPDPGMQGETDQIVCMRCLEPQPED